MSDYTHHKEYNRSNDRWRIVRRHEDEPDDILATVQTEKLANILLEILDGPEIVITVHQGMIDDICCPNILSSQMTFLLVDHDYTDSDHEDFTEATDESGNQISAFISQLAARNPTGAHNSDRLIDSYFVRGASARGV